MGWKCTNKSALFRLIAVIFPAHQDVNFGHLMLSAHLVGVHWTLLPWKRNCIVINSLSNYIATGPGIHSNPDIATILPDLAPVRGKVFMDLSEIKTTAWRVELGNENKT